MIRYGVVADDITGANDIGIMFAKAGIITHVYDYQDFDPARFNQQQESKPAVVILDTNSRLDDPELAYAKVKEATEKLRQAGTEAYINKTCSVFRGNIGAEFDAMLDVLSSSFAVIVLGFPKNGRTTVEGVHYVHGKRLEESEFSRDPVHPMKESHLVDILQKQTKRPVRLIDHRILSQGEEALREAIMTARESEGYVILDVRDQQDLRLIARVARHETVLCGSSALAEELALISKDLPAEQNQPLELDSNRKLGILCTAGSLMPQTAAQIEHMRSVDITVLELDTMKLLLPSEREHAIEHMCELITGQLLIGEHVVLHSTNDPQGVTQTKARAKDMGMSSTGISRLVSGTLAEITAQVIERTGQNRILIAGGETSAAVCERLGIKGLRVWKEIEPGLPSCISLTEPPRLLVLKSGSFGKPQFFQTAVEHLLLQ